MIREFHLDKNNNTPVHDLLKDDTFTGWYVHDKIPEILVPSYDEIMSRESFYCAHCNTVLCLANTVSNIIRHAGIHYPELRKKKQQKIANKYLEQSNEVVFSDEQMKFIANQIIRLIMLSSLPFRLVESEEFSSFSNFLPNRKEMSDLTEHVGGQVQEKVKEVLKEASAVYLSFDEWSDIQNNSFLGITSRALIGAEYKDFILGLKHCTQKSDAEYINTIIQDTIISYDIQNVTSCVSDNCNLMIAVGNKLPFMRFPCVCHILNLIMGTFIESAREHLQPIIKIVNLLEKSTNYQMFINDKGCKKVSSFCITRWTSFCCTVNDIIETQLELKEFLQDKFDTSAIERANELIEFLNDYRKIITFYEADEFGASGFFLRDICIITDHLNALKNTAFAAAANQAIKKIQELKMQHNYFWTTFCVHASLLNPMINIEHILTKEIIKSSTMHLQNLINKRFPPKKPQESSSQPCKYTKLPTLEQQYLTVSQVKKIFIPACQTLKEFWFNMLENPNDKGISIVAIEILGTLITSCSTEREFSGTRRIIGYLRSNLRPEITEAQIIICGNEEISKNTI